jgi:glycosyltransferase involved in cell wall biosynthesis
VVAASLADRIGRPSLVMQALAPAQIDADGRRHRIAFVAPLHFGARAYVGGGERYPLNLARGVLAASTDAQVDLIAAGDEPRTVSPQPRLGVHVLPVTLPGRNAFDHVSAALVEALERVDLVHVHQAFTRPSQLAILVAKVLGKPVVLTDHGARANEIDSSVRYLDVVDRFVFQSRFAAEQFAVTGRQTTIPGGADTRFFRPSSQPLEREFVLFVGRLLPHKGIDRLLSALPPGLPCVVAGNAYAPDYARYIRAIAAGRQVTFVDDADDFTLRDLYRRAWATVVPSVYRDAWGNVYRAPELMGFTALESMACGTPTIVSTAGALPEFVRHGSTGYIFRSLDELCAQIRSLAGGDVDADEMGRRARKLVHEEYSLDVVGRRLWDAYLDVWQEQG